MAHPGCPRDTIAGTLSRRFAFVSGAIVIALLCARALSGQSSPAAYYTVEPCRVVDTRNPAGSHGGPALAAGGTRTFGIGSQCGVSSTALAVSANITVTGPGGPGHLTVYPAGAPAPLASSINFRAGQTRANNVIVPLGAGGGLVVASGQATGTTHFLIDINGFFETPTPASTAVETLKRLETQTRMDDENAPILIRGGAEYYNPEVVDLVALGPNAVDRILVEFRRPVTPILDDTPLSLLAYVLEKIGDPRAIPVLADWLEQNVFAELIWAPDFVTHTLKVLDGQAGLNTVSYTYRIGEVFDTIAQARVGMALVRKLATASPAAAGPTPTCWQTIIVTGINPTGQQETILLTHKIAGRDIQQIIDEETNQRRKDELQGRKNGWESSDRAGYDGSDYQIVPGATISQKSNCGGLVEQNVLNAVAAAKGFPVRIGEGSGVADSIRTLAAKFGGLVTASALDEMTVVSHENSTGASLHVESPIQAGATTALVASKDNQGFLRHHTVDKNDDSLGGFLPARRKYDRPWFVPGTDITTRLYRVDPNRILSIVVDSSACTCTPGAAGNVSVAITQPTVSTTSERVITVAGTVGDPAIASATLKVNGAPQSVAVSGGAFSTPVVLRSGNNAIRVDVTAPDGRQGCADRSIASTTPQTSLSVTLTWTLGNADVDLYVTQPDNETAWYSHRTTSIGGHLDVDNTSGFGPENYFLSAAEGDTVLSGTYTIRVHYYRDALRQNPPPTRIVGWRVVVLLHEGTPMERQEIFNGTLSLDDPSNSSPGSSGPDWATVTQVPIP
ncbi:MAG: DUF2135 domain-containing protein [Thermoanaerobaculia bacterium]